MAAPRVTHAIRPAAPTDAIEMARIYNDGIAERVATFETRTKSAGELAELIEGGALVLVAERDGEVVGQTGITFEWSDWRNGWYWWIQSVYVREDARRAGVFSAIYRHLEAMALADPTVIGIRLYVERENARAQATYRKLGLEDEAYFLMARYPLPGREAHVRGE